MLSLFDEYEIFSDRLVSTAFIKKVSEQVKLNLENPGKGILIQVVQPNNNSICKNNFFLIPETFYASKNSKTLYL